MLLKMIEQIVYVLSAFAKYIMSNAGRWKEDVPRKSKKSLKLSRLYQIGIFSIEKSCNDFTDP